MPVPVLKRIQARFQDLSPKHRKIAGYLAEHYDKAAFQTAKELARDLGVSEATVTRFAVVLGYEGYPAMSRALGEMVRTRITTVERLEISLQTPKAATLENVMNRDIANIKRTLGEQDPVNFQEAVNKIVKARRIFVVSFRSAAALGVFLEFYLQILRKNCRQVKSSDTMINELADIGPDDLVIGISFARYTRQTVEGLRFAQERGAQRIAITDANTSPLATYGDTVLVAQRDMSSFIDSFVAPLSLINALIVAAGTEDSARTRASFRSLEALWKQYHVYYEE